MRITDFVLGLVLCLPLVAQGKDFAGDKFADAALKDCLLEIGVSVNKTEQTFRPLAAQTDETKVLREGLVVKATKQLDARTLHLTLSFPSVEAAKLAKSREVIQCVVDEVKSKLRESGEADDDDDEDECEVAVAKRRRCGAVTIKKYKCVQQGCCFDPAKPRGIGCFHPRGVEVKGDKIAHVLSPEKIKKISAEAGCTQQRAQPDCSDWCFHRKYRTIDGTCNNLKNPLWGATLTQLRRVLPAIYEDGISTPPGWKKDKKYNGFKLPSARFASTEILSAPDVNMDSKYSYMLMQWGQFVDHDTDKVPTNPSSGGFKTGTPCSKNCEHEAPCFPIHIPENDERIKTTKCMGFTRSASICNGSPKLSPREQFNQLTAFIDASNVYGSSQGDIDAMRDPSYREYLVKGEEIDGKFYLPVDNTGEFAGCEVEHARKADSPCFRAGDGRANEQLGLTMMHTVWHREHNRIVHKLKKVNPNLDAETYFQEARKILIAEVQKITYEDWLPKILGSKGMQLLGRYTGYKDDVDPSISNNFASATFRIGHAMILPEMPRLGKDFKPIPEGNLPLHHAFFAPHKMREEGGMDPLARGFLHTAVKMVDSSKMMNIEIIEKLFKLARKIALDLGALNLQRGRDHGLPPYTHFREYCGLKDVKTFQDLQHEIKNADVRDKLQKVYGHVDNIDLFSGGLAEDPVGDSRTGPTFMCLLVEQFKRLRDGDRFYYENPDMFTPEQLAEIKKVTLSRVICDNGDHLDEVQPDAFLKVDYPAGYRKCDDEKSIPVLDLWAWKTESIGGCPSTASCGTPARGSSASSKQLCCCGSVYGSDKNPVTGARFHCCGDQAYDPKQDSCCDGVLNCGKDEATYECCGKAAFDPRTENCVNGEVVRKHCGLRCGGATYNPTKSICCGKKLYPKGRTTTCCGSYAYTPDRQICCNGVVRKMKTIYMQCCGTAVYDPRVNTCCGGTVVGHRPKQTPRKRYDSGSGSGSDSGTHGTYSWRRTSTSTSQYGYCDLKRESLCCGDLRKGRPFTSADSCCGTLPYNWNSKLCCSGKLVDGACGRDRCCGKQAYNPNRQTCCDTDKGLQVFEGVGSCATDTGNSCADKPYNALTHICCGNKLFPGGANIQCCKGTAYNTATHVCCRNRSCHKAVFGRKDPASCCNTLRGIF